MLQHELSEHMDALISIEANLFGVSLHIKNPVFRHAWFMCHKDVNEVTISKQALTDNLLMLFIHELHIDPSSLTPNDFELQRDVIVYFVNTIDDIYDARDGLLSIDELNNAYTTVNDRDPKPVHNMLGITYGTIVMMISDEHILYGNGNGNGSLYFCELTKMPPLCLNDFYEVRYLQFVHVIFHFKKPLDEGTIYYDMLLPKGRHRTRKQFGFEIVKTQSIYTLCISVKHPENTSLRFYVDGNVSVHHVFFKSIYS